jgi:hypothetical protein
MHWVGFALAILAGVALYWCRCRHRLWYGVGEILVALLLLYIFFFPEAQGVVGMNSWIGSLGPVWGFYLSRTVTLFGGLYALVRGLDNIDALEKWNRVRQGVRREGLWMRRCLNVFGLIFGMIRSGDHLPLGTAAALISTRRLGWT